MIVSSGSTVIATSQQVKDAQTQNLQYKKSKKRGKKLWLKNRHRAHIMRRLFSLLFFLNLKYEPAIYKYSFLIVLPFAVSVLKETHPESSAINIIFMIEEKNKG